MMAAVQDAPQDLPRDLPMAGGPDLETLFRAHYGGLVRLAMVLTGDPARADELAQEAFVRFHRARARPAPGAELGYLRRIVVNLTHSEHRHLRVVREAPPEAGYLSTPPTAPDVEAEHRDRRRRIVAAVRRLPERQRDCVVLHYFSDLRDHEIAEVLGISAGAVKTHLHRARAALAAELEALR
jgi:RNA polymerase sigma-70 factor (sigma-E family)